jgi:hypothetical protein
MVKLTGSPKELKVIPTYATLTKWLQGALRILIYTWMGFFPITQTVPQAGAVSCSPTHIPRRSIALSKTDLWLVRKGAGDYPTLAGIYSKI